MDAGSESPLYEVGKLGRLCLPRASSVNIGKHDKRRSYGQKMFSSRDIGYKILVRVRDYVRVRDKG